jgi:cell division septum initiation protein DivIVA
MEIIMSRKKSVTINSGGGPVFTEKVDNRDGKITGRSDKHYHGLSDHEVLRLFENLIQKVEQHPKLSNSDKKDAKAEIEEIRQELTRKEQADESFLMRRFRNLAQMAPDILEVTLATITNPALGLGVFAKKLAEKARATL